MDQKRVKIAELSFDTENARLHDAKNLDAIKRSLTKFGQQKPLVVDKKGHVIAGNGTLAAAKELGWQEIEVVYTKLDKTKAKAYAIADNRTAELAAWDELMLGKHLASLQLEGFDIEDIGFSEADIPTTEVEGNIEHDKVPEVEQNIHGVKRGDIWQLGNHRLMCGDSTSKEDVEKLMDGQKADMVFTDPPYNVDYDYNFHSDKKPLDEYLQWTSEWVCRCGESLKDSAWFLAKNAPKNLLDFLPLVRGLSWEFKNLIVWVHPPHLFPPNRFYDNWEAIAAFSRGKAKFNNKAQTRTVEKPLSEGGGHHDNGRIGDVWDGIKYISAGAMASKEAVLRPGTKEKEHPCQMPLALPERAVLFCSNDGDLAYEPFCGSGSTLIACEKTNRKCYGMEIDPHYCSVIIERWQQFTNQKARKCHG